MFTGYEAVDLLNYEVTNLRAVKNDQKLFLLYYMT